MRITSEFRRLGALPLPLTVLAVGAALASGCGSGGDEETATEPASAPAAAAKPGSGAPQRDAPSVREAAREAAKAAKEGDPATASDNRRDGGKGSDGGQSGDSGSSRPPGGDARTGDSRVASPNSERCPSGVSRAECEVIAEQRSDAPSFPVSSVEDCVEAIGKEQCERLLETERAAEKGGPSIDVAECLNRPTPRCEEVLRPILEAEQAASNAKK